MGCYPPPRAMSDGPHILFVRAREGRKLRAGLLPKVGLNPMSIAHGIKDRWSG